MSGRPNSHVLYVNAYDQAEVVFTTLWFDDAQEVVDGQPDPPVTWSEIRTELACRIFENRGVTVIYPTSQCYESIRTLDPAIVEADIEFDSKPGGRNCAARLELCSRETLRAICADQWFELGEAVLASIQTFDARQLQQFWQPMMVDSSLRPDTPVECLYCTDDALFLRWLNPVNCDPAELRRLFETACAEFGYRLVIVQRNVDPRADA